MGKLTISTGPFSIAMLVITRGYPNSWMVYDGKPYGIWDFTSKMGTGLLDYKKTDDQWIDLSENMIRLLCPGRTYSPHQDLPIWGSPKMGDLQ